MHSCRVGVPDEYMNIPCPVLRALTGSGYLELMTPELGTPLAGVRDAFEDVLGFVGSALDVLTGAAEATPGAIDNKGNLRLLRLAEVA